MFWRYGCGEMIVAGEVMCVCERSDEVGVGTFAGLLLPGVAWRLREEFWEGVETGEVREEGEWREAKLVKEGG